MPRAAPRSFLRKTNLRLNSGGVAPQATVYDSETADQELQIKKIMISGGADQGSTCSFILVPPGVTPSETQALKEEYMIYRFALLGTSGIVDFLDKPAIRVPEGYTFALIAHNLSLAANMDCVYECVVWHYPV